MELIFIDQTKKKIILINQFVQIYSDYNFDFSNLGTNKPLKNDPIRI